MNWDLVLFDLDGTLVETAPEIADAVNDTLGEFGWPSVDDEQVARWIGHGTEPLLAQAAARASREPVGVLRDGPRWPSVLAAYDRHYAKRCGTRSRLYPGVRETLAALRAGGTRLAIVTNKETRYTDRVLAAHDLGPLVDRVICGDTLSTRKPDPAGVQACIDDFGATRERTLFVGDSAIDAATARAAGVTVWLLPWGYNGGEPVADCRPDCVIADLEGLGRAAGRPAPA